jgi:transglutaminase-like putative cysteine protease
MFYSISHVTRFRYAHPVHESVMELKMQPRSETGHALRSFQILTNPRAQLFAYTDHFGNAVYHFNILRQHRELRIEAVSVIEVKESAPLPDAADTLEWQRYNSFNLTGEHYDLLEGSHYARDSSELKLFMSAHNLDVPRGDPLTALKHLNRTIYDSFAYDTEVTQVHSPIAHALEANTTPK